MSVFLSALLNLFFPPRCVFCQSLIGAQEAGICLACAQNLPRTAGKTAEQKLPFLAFCLSPLYYQGAVRESFHRYKFRAARGYAATYATLMFHCLAGHSELEFDLITWVPLSANRRRKRGYDQAFLLAQAIAKFDGKVPILTLQKTMHNAAQSGLGTDDAARRANVLGAYEVLDATLVAGKRVLLIDDIVTTGSTLSECARILETAGATRVFALTLARARHEAAKKM